MNTFAKSLLLGVTSAWQELPIVDPADFVQYSVQSPVDHYNYQNQDTYAQRVWKNDKYYDSEHGGPVFLYICGEYTCGIRDDRLFPFMVGASHGAELYALEHRFYGESIPNGNLESDNYRLLNSEQALSDIATFVQNITEGHTDRQVVVVGGSYPGALSAWFRQRYPQLAVASWSSSGVVYPITDFWKFDEQIYNSTIKSGEWCPTTIQDIFGKVEDALVGDNSTLRNETMTAMGAYPEMNNGDFAFYFADIFVESVQYGNRTGLCEAMKGVQDLELTEQLEAVNQQAQVAGVAPTDYCRNALKNTTQENPAGRSWTYQYCTEFGWYQTPSHEHPMRSQLLLNETYWVDYCNEIYGFALNSERSVAEFAGRHTAGSNTVITNGGEDPWQWATELNPNEDINQLGLMADCDDCGHCAELYTPLESDPEQLQEVRKQVQKFIKQVLNEETQDTQLSFLQ